MNQDQNDGTHDLTCWIDSNAPGGTSSSTVSLQEEIKNEETSEHLNIHNSSRFLDKYLFYYSSRL